MSTQEVAELIASVNEMTQTVANKNKEIDAKVNEATTAVPDKIKSQMKMQIWVDATLGNDSNDGLSQANPKRTIKSAIDSATNGGSVNIYLLGRQVYEISSDISCGGKFIVIDSYGASWGQSATRSTIRSVQNGGSKYEAGQFLTQFGSEIHLQQVNVETVLFDTQKDNYHDYLCSLFSGVSANSQVWLYGCTVTLNNGPLTHQHPDGSFGKLDLYMNSVGFSINENLSIPDGSSVIMGHYGTSALPFTLYVAATGLPSGKTWSDMVTANVSAANTNITFT